MNNNESSVDAKSLRWEHTTLGALFVGYCGYYLCRSNLAVCADAVIAENTANGFDRSAYGMMISWSIGVYAVGKLLNGRIVDALGGKWTFVAGALLSALFTAIFGFGGPAVFLVAWCANRYSQSIGWPGMMSISSRWFPYDRRATIAAFLSMSFLIGDAGVRAGLGGLLAAGWQWRSIFVFAAFCLAGIAVAAAFLINKPAHLAAGSRIDSVAKSPELSDAAATNNAVAGLLVRTDFWLVCGLSCGLTLIRETFNNWSALFLKESGGMNAATSAVYSAIFPLAGAFAVYFTGWLTRRIGNRHGIVSAFSLSGLVVALLLLGRLPLAGNPALVATLLASSSMLLLGPYSFCAGVMAIELGGKNATATAAGWIDAAGYVGSILAGAGVAEISKRYGWRSAFDILAGVSVAMIVTAMVYARVSRRQQEATAVPT